MASPDRFELCFTVPYPPSGLLPNSRAFWGAKQKAGREYADLAGMIIMAAMREAGLALPRPYLHGLLATTHHFTRHPADPDNCVGALKPLIDVLQAVTKASGKRFRLGIIENDRYLEVAQPGRRGYSPLGKVIECRLQLW